MALSAKETKKRKCDGGQVAPGSHKRKKREAGSASASAEKTATQGKAATTSPTGKTVRKTGAGKATTGKTVSKTGAGKATMGKTMSKTGAGKAMNQDASGEIQEMKMVQMNEWISKCRNAEREKKGAQNDYNGLQCIRANWEKELKDSRHAVQDLEKELNDSRRAVQDLERENADLRLWMHSLDACCDVEIATNKFVSARTAASYREGKDVIFVWQNMRNSIQGQGGDLDRQMRAFTYTRNRICHDRDIRHVSHEEFLRTGDDIRDRLADLAVRTAPDTL
ncbi:hypothetical protein PF008_g24666 [Phytophthora fragariae]|uniref:Uncharacterized protein n=1 Tax=Phytophthora fragariae TaxID=53985 RepID=A0A6G0QM88_9STRA|nr:hypothetical protein PF008_g24666 [Phytophthora fragariae]